MNRMVRSGVGLVVVLLLSVIAIQGGDSSAASVTSAKDTIKLGWSAGIDILDPNVSSNGPDMILFSQMYETLMDVNPNTRDLIPRLATSWKAINNTTWQFKLRQGVKFQNGDPFKADAVKFSIERILDPKLNSAHKARLQGIDHVDVVDDSTVNVVTKGPFPILPYLMQPIGGSGRIYIVDPTYVREKGDAYLTEHPMGTGPYTFVEWRKGQWIKLERNKNYWGPAPEFEKAEFHFITENSTRVAALLKGEVDLINRVPLEDVDRVAKTPGYKITEAEGLVNTLHANVKFKPLDDLRVRQALSYAINLQEIVDTILQGKARVLPIPMAPFVRQFDKSLKPWPYDPVKAKELLRSAGYPNGFSINTNMASGRYVGDRAIYEAINAQLGQVGVKVNPTLVEWGRMNHMFNDKTAGPFYIIGWDFGEAEAAKFDSLFHSAATASVFYNSEYDQLSKQANNEMDPQKQKDLWYRAEKVVYDQRGFLATWQTFDVLGASDQLVWPGVFGDNIQLKDFKKR